MPELPEVETVRRGLAPVMEGARFTKVELNWPDLRRPLPKDFVKRLEGKTVTGLGRRAKYLLADLSSGEVLMMHLGMSGSFRVANPRHPEVAASFDRHPHPEEPAKRASRRMKVTAQDEGGPRRMRPGPGRRPTISGLPEIGTIDSKSAPADLRRLASPAPHSDRDDSAL